MTSRLARRPLTDAPRVLVVLALGAASACAAPPSEESLAAPPAPEAEAPPVGEDSAQPDVSPDGDGVLLTWLEPAGGATHALRWSRRGPEGWSQPRTIVRDSTFFVNWADFPSLRRIGDTLVAHWLERGPTGGYDYGVRIVRSADGGASWGPPVVPHGDGTPTEHGFVSLVRDPATGGPGAVWLDGRAYAVGPDGGAPTREMQLRYRALDGGDERVLDERVCDCCQTDAARTPDGPLVVYRGRTDGEIRDIRRVRWTADGWSEPATVHADGWHIAACPVNGPAVDAHGTTAAVAWFTAPEDEARVNVAFSDDSGATFGPPVRVDQGRPAGRVDVLLLEDRTALVSWIERTEEGEAEVRARYVAADGRVSPPTVLTATSAARASGFPRMTSLAGGDVLVAWTAGTSDGTTVRAARLPGAARPAPVRGAGDR